MRYCLDTNVFVQAHRTYYAMEIVPGFWDFLKREALNKNICIPKMVFEEIKEGDNLAKWLRGMAQIDGFIEEPDENVYNSFGQIANFVVKNYEKQHVNTFLSCADPWVIAHAKAHGYILVTMEMPKIEERNRRTNLIQGPIKIPNICRHFGVSYQNTYQLLRNLNAKFVLYSEDQ